MEAFIDGRCAISPQDSFNRENIFEEIISSDNIRSLRCVEPQYSQFLDPMASRRMSRIMKMSISASIRSLREAGLAVPDAVVAGTGLGCLEDTEKFLRSMIVSNEGLLNPTPFINSTHNTIAASIAILLKCYGYNNTFSHRGFSFESALLDSLMLLNEGRVENVLVGSADEIIKESLSITDRLGFWRKEAINNIHLLDHQGKGSLPGEGTAFFLLNKNQTNNSIAKILSVSTFYKPDEYSVIQKNISEFLKDNSGESFVPDLAILGLNGDERTDNIYQRLRDDLLKEVPCTYYKHLCGEYDTSSSFALYLATCLIRDQKIPEIIRLDNKPVEKIKTILIYNNLRNNHHSMILLSAC
jgi:3-oxoacyl-[acyl-carrier-protein] synthase II